MAAESSSNVGDLEGSWRIDIDLLRGGEYIVGEDSDREEEMVRAEEEAVDEEEEDELSFLKREGREKRKGIVRARLLG